MVGNASTRAKLPPWYLNAESSVRCYLLQKSASDEVETTSAHPDEAFQQIVFADKILLNKIDLVDATEAIKVE